MNSAQITSTSEDFTDDVLQDTATIGDPEMAQGSIRIRPELPDFVIGLQDRNVLLKESQDIDPRLGHIKFLTLQEFVETKTEEDVYTQLWALDQAKCNGSNEACFQRTLMVSFIARHWSIYATTLDFSVEESWTYPSMPTRAYWKGESLLAQPKPDLAVCFSRKALIPDHLWNTVPITTKHLMRYETGDTRLFHFLTIEAEKIKTSTIGSIGLRQSLNNASQALHNMFEFFKEAGPQHENMFFDKVRFFTVVASTECITFRIHRATREDGLDQGFIIPEYPLKFEHREFCSISKDKMERRTVLETFKKILLGYGVKELFPLLQSAASAVVEKLSKDAREMYILKGRQGLLSVWADGAQSTSDNLSTLQSGPMI